MRPRIHAYFGLVVAFASAFIAHTARAAPPASFPSSSKICKQSTLTGAKFMQFLGKIIKHGNLTDIPFMQNALGTKFSLSPLDYQSDQLLGAPIKVKFYEYAGELKKGDLIAVIAFNDNPMSALDRTFMHDCLHLSRDDFYDDFGSGFRNLPPPLPSPPLPGQTYEPPTSASVFKYLNNIGKNDSQFELQFDYNLADLGVSRISVAQRK